MKKLGLVVMALLSTLGYGASALAAVGPYDSSIGTVSFAPANPRPGENVIVTITGCTPGEPLEISLAGTTVAVTSCTAAPAQGFQRPQQSAGGVAATEITAPAESGTYRYTVTGSQGYDRSASLVVAAPVLVLPQNEETSSDWISLLMVVMVGAVALALAVLVHVRRTLPL